jgi:hypothetical protein
MSKYAADISAPPRAKSNWLQKLFWAFFIWPIKVLWKIVTKTANALGIIISLLLGAAFMGAGYILTSTIIGAFIGIPMFIVGFFLFLRALY